MNGKGPATAIGLALVPGLAWLALAAFDSRILSVVRITLQLSIAVALSSLVVGVTLAVLLYRTDIGCRSFLKLLLWLMAVMPLYLQVAGWDAGFGRQGWYTYAADKLVQPPLTGWRAAFWIHTLAAIPWVTVIVAIALKAVEPELEEDARLDGGVWQVIRRVTLPRAASGIILAAIWTALNVASEMTVTDMYQVRTFAEEVYSGFALGDDLLTLSIKIVVPNLLLTCLLVHWGLRRAEQLAPIMRRTTYRPPTLFLLGKSRLGFSLLACLVVGVITIVPIANLLYKTGIVVTQVEDERLRQWSIYHFFQILFHVAKRFQPEFFWTAIASIGGASLTIVFAAVVAWLGRQHRSGRMLLTVAIAFGLAVPGPVIGLAILSASNLVSVYFAELGIERTLFPVIVAYSARALPVAALICWFSFRSISSDELDAASIDGAGRWTTLIRLVIPRCRSSLVTAWLVACMICVGDLSASVLVLPPSTPTVAWSIFQLAHAGVDDQLAGLCLWMTAGMFACGGLIFVFRRAVDFPSVSQQNEMNLPQIG